VDSNAFSFACSSNTSRFMGFNPMRGYFKVA